MANISEILKGKNARDEARVTELRAEREELSYMRDASLEDITTSPDRYRQYLTLQADNIRCSVGNVALTMAQMPDATMIGSTDFWHSQGRYVLDEAMNDGATWPLRPTTGGQTRFSVRSTRWKTGTGLP